MPYNFDYTKIEVSSQKTTDQEYINRLRTRRVKIFISSILAITGITILATQIIPLGYSYLYGKQLEKQSFSLMEPTPKYELEPEDQDLPYYDPGLSYFQNLVRQISPTYVAGVQDPASNSTENNQIKIDESYSQDMLISIPKIEIEDVTVTPNVDSFDEKIYNQALKRGLAHFKGTPLPGDGGNSFIYGHSAVDSFFNRNPNYTETMFTRLENVEISDKIILVKDGQQYTYTVQKKKITDPNDFEVLSGIEGKETVTLMTCWPLGIGAKRLIVIGELTDG